MCCSEDEAVTSEGLGGGTDTARSASPLLERKDSGIRSGVGSFLRKRRYLDIRMSLKQYAYVSEVLYHSRWRRKMDPLRSECIFDGEKKTP